MTMPAAADQADVFAANRARGRIALTVAAADGTTHRSRIVEDGSLRVRFPGPTSRDLEAVIVNTAGGIAGGDRLDVSVAVGEGARLVVTTAAAEKIYRSLGPDAAIHLELSVQANGRLLWLPQETILFDRARLARTIDVELAENATLVLAEALVFGRAAMGEAVERGRLFDRWRVRRNGRLVFAETVRLGEAIGEALREPAVAAGHAAVATLFMCPADAARIAAVRERAKWQGEVALSAWNGFAVARFVAAAGAALRADLMAALTALGVTLPRLWLN
ncbi:MAG: urease accessory protein UreD [Xanthobacteraceae bacterium]